MSASDFRTRDEVQDALIKRAHSDEAFRSLLLSSPRDAVRQEFGIDIPERVELTVHEEGSANFHLVLPISDRVSDKELADIVAGGNNPQSLDGSATG